MAKLTCPHCSKACKTAKGLEQHIKSSGSCRSAQNAFRMVEEVKMNSPPKRKADDAYIHVLDNDQAARHKLAKANSPSPRKLLSETEAKEAKQQNPHHTGDEPFIDPFAQSSSEGDFDPYATPSDYSSEGPGMMMDSDKDEEASELGEDKEGQLDKVQVNASKKCITQFKNYVRNAYQNFAQLEEKEKFAAKLLRTLLKKKASLDTYEAVMEWHLITSGKMRPGSSLGKNQHFVSRDKLMKKLRIRYNMDNKYAKPETIVLPYTKTKVTIWRKDARNNVQSILTDPRWKDEDFLYFDNDPFAPPPDDLDYIGDVNTGEAFIETYKRLITKPNQILVGIPLYIDGAVTGQFDKLQVEALKMTLTILNRKARDKEYAWKPLGYVTNYAREDSRGQKIFVDSGHVAAHELYMDESDEEGLEGTETDFDKAADYHCILRVLMESLRELIEEGMMFDVRYNGKLYKDCELVFFVPFVKCDGDEGDKLCSRYRSRGAHISQLCRYCHCPNAQTDDPKANFKYKTWREIKKLVDNGNEDALQKISQINVDNAFHGLRFGLHNDRGIHGACPWELLHAILLGIFKYCRDCFFQQIGPKSALEPEINALSQMIGIHLTRQSDRNKPRTKFAKGIHRGKLMAKEYTGVLLIMAAILRCEEGQSLLKGARKKHFRDDWLIRDWILLVETLLQWEAYLTSDQMDKKHVQKLEKKNRFIMFLLKKVGNRSTGMGFKIMKFHAILHLAEDIKMFGVPMNVDTGSNESHHKTTKVAAKLTQKDIKTFERQTSDRSDDFEVLDLANEEINHRPLWEYFGGQWRPNIVQKDDENTIGGMMFEVFWNDETENAEFQIMTRMKDKDKVALDSDFLHFLVSLQDELVDNETSNIDKLQVFTEHTRSGQIFRAHPNYRGKGVWRDWVMIQWQEGNFPAQIWGYLDLTAMPDGCSVKVDENNVVVSGVYAVIESALYVDEEDPWSDIFVPLQLDTMAVTDDGHLKTRKFYIVDVETFKDPIVVIPNIGSIDQYLLMKPRREWAEDFIAWLEMPHKHDQMEMLPPPEEADEDSE